MHIYFNNSFTYFYMFNNKFYMWFRGIMFLVQYPVQRNRKGGRKERKEGRQEEIKEMKRTGKANMWVNTDNFIFFSFL